MTTPELDFDHSLLGKEHHAGPFQVTRELIDGFCTTLGETNPLYLDEEAARGAGYDTVLAPNSLCMRGKCWRRWARSKRVIRSLPRRG